MESEFERRLIVEDFKRGMKEYNDAIMARFQE